MKTTGSTKALQSLESKLSHVVEYVSLRGLQDGPFLFAEHLGRAVEVSTNDGKWWIEFWERSDNENNLSTGEREVNSEEEARKLVLEWFQGAFWTGGTRNQFKPASKKLEDGK